ncbi:MAG: glycerol-3-phosphate 1-O-acyltransferase PlsY [Planctomycetota bacterium]
MDWTGYILCWCVAFLCGSIPFAVLIGRAKGVDIRKVGSGNPGATNLGRAIGKKWGLLCFGLDVGKGLVPVLGFGLWLGAMTVLDQLAFSGGASGVFSGVISGTVWAWQWVGLAIAAVIGHMFSPWLGFKGGKGAATGLGASLGLFPFVTVPGVICGLVWVVVAKATGYVGLSSCLAAALLPVLTAVSGLVMGLALPPLMVFVSLTALLAALVIVRHRGNLQRLVKGTEPKAAWTGKA